jgi:aspartate/methionine/tyrosine aminotransferase
MSYPPLAKRLADIQPFHVMALLARARELEAQGRDIVHMEIGEPDFVTPQPIIDAAQRALAQGSTHYTPALGLPQLRAAIARFYGERYGLDIAPGRVIVTPGGSGALLLVLGALVNPGDEVLVPDPGYPCNRHFVRFVEGVPVGVAVDAASQYQLTAALIERHWSARTVAAMLASPSNPTGTLIEKNELARIIAAIQARGGAAVVDEIYHGLTYDTKAVTALVSSDDVFVINSFSKYFNMTGWRLGWIVAPQAYVPQLDKLAQNLFLAAPTLAQHAALAAFEPATLAILEERRREFQRRRDYLVPELRALGFEILVVPQGAFYVYANCARFTADSQVFANRLLEEAGVAITPGIDFGANQPQQHVRFAYTTSLERLEVGVERLRGFIRA